LEEQAAATRGSGAAGQELEEHEQAQHGSHAHRPRARTGKSKARAQVTFAATQIAPAYLLPTGALDAAGLAPAGAAPGIAAVGRDGRALGLGASLPAAMWKELRHGAPSALSTTHGSGSTNSHPMPVRTKTRSALGQHAGAAELAALRGVPGVREAMTIGTARTGNWEAGEGEVGDDLLPSEVAHLQRLARLDAKLGYFRDAAGACMCICACMCMCAWIV